MKNITDQEKKQFSEAKWERAKQEKCFCPEYIKQTSLMTKLCNLSQTQTQKCWCVFAKIKATESDYNFNIWTYCDMRKALTVSH